jgi:hypothetical protein
MSNKKNNQTDDSPKVLKLFGDISFIVVMMMAAMTLMLMCVHLAEKITITVGK